SGHHFVLGRVGRNQVSVIVRICRVHRLAVPGSWGKAVAEDPLEAAGHASVVHAAECPQLEWSWSTCRGQVCEQCQPVLAGRVRYELVECGSVRGTCDLA